MCGRRFGKCTGCGIEFTDKLDEKVKEDEIGDLDVQNKPQTPTATPTPVTPVPVEEKPPQTKDEPTEPIPKEPKKVTKKKVALKF